MKLASHTITQSAESKAAFNDVYATSQQRDLHQSMTIYCLLCSSEHVLRLLEGHPQLLEFTGFFYAGVIPAAGRATNVDA